MRLNSCDYGGGEVTLDLNCDISLWVCGVRVTVRQILWRLLPTDLGTTGQWKTFAFVLELVCDRRIQ